MDTLNPGDKLRTNESLYSSNGAYRLTMQADGNLVLYAGNSAVWATNTVSSWTPFPTFPAVEAVLQTDGNFVLYNGLRQAIWATGTDGQPVTRVVLQDDRNLVLYRADGSPAWASHTWIDVGGQRPAIKTSSNIELGWGKHVETTATLYRDGRLIVDSYQKNDNWIGGLRNRILVVVVDSMGRSIWVSTEIVCPTRCSVLDPSCASYGRSNHVQQFPAAVGFYAQRLDVYQQDQASFVDLRNVLIDVIKAGTGIAQELIDAWNQLTK